MLDPNYNAGLKKKKNWNILLDIQFGLFTLYQIRVENHAQNEQESVFSCFERKLFSVTSNY